MCFYWSQCLPQGRSPNSNITVFRHFCSFNNTSVFAAAWISLPSLHCDGRLKDLPRTTSLKHLCGAPKFISIEQVLSSSAFKLILKLFQWDLLWSKILFPLWNRYTLSHQEACCCVNLPMIKTPKFCQWHQSQSQGLICWLFFSIAGFHPKLWISYYVKNKWFQYFFDSILFGLFSLYFWCLVFSLHIYPFAFFK